MENNNGISTSAFHHNRKDFQITNREHEVLSKTIKESTEKELLGQICYELIRVRMNTAATAELLKGFHRSLDRIGFFLFLNMVLMSLICYSLFFR